MKQILILLFIVPFALFGQKYQKGTLLFKNGKTLTCLLKPPSSPTDKKIETKISEDADKISYRSEELKSVIVLTGDSTEYEFSWQPSKKLLSDGLDYGWLYVIAKGYATLYGSSDGYKINKKGELIEIGRSSGFSSPDFGFYTRRPGEEYVTLIGIYSPATVGLNNYFRKSSAKYFSDSPEIVKRINAKEFKIGDIRLVVMEYNDLKTKEGVK